MALVVGRPVLGRVLMGQSHWRVEAMTASRFAKLRERFEARLGERVKFTGERLDDLGAQMAGKEAPFDKSLVPPRLLEHPQQIQLTSSRVPEPPRGRSPDDLAAELFAAQYRAFADENIPLLDHRTPREAARDPALRPKLVNLLKVRIRDLDQKNLETGRADDINWLLRDLSLDEIIFEPPPPRPRPARGVDEMEDKDEEALEYYENLPDPPPLPAEPLSVQEASTRLGAGVHAFELAADAVEELQLCGSTLVEDLDELTKELLNENEFAILVTLTTQAYFTLAPPGTRAPRTEFDNIEESMRREFERLQEMMANSLPDFIEELFAHCRQPGLLQVLAGLLTESSRTAPKKIRPRAENELPMIVLLRVVVDELDRALRE